MLVFAASRVANPNAAIQSVLILLMLHRDSSLPLKKPPGRLGVVAAPQGNLLEMRHRLRSWKLG